jgi:hypothetical protein
MLQQYIVTKYRNKPSSKPTLKSYAPSPKFRSETSESDYKYSFTFTMHISKAF